MADHPTRTPVRGLTIPGAAARPARETRDDLMRVERDLAVLRAELNERLAQGAETMQQLKDADKANANAIATRGESRHGPVVVGFIVSFAVPILGLAYAAGRYPTRDDYEANGSVVDGSMDRIRERLEVSERVAAERHALTQKTQQDQAKAIESTATRLETLTRRRR